MEKDLNNITVVGAGVLGGQIAWHSAFFGKTVVVHDISEESLFRCKETQKQYASIYIQEMDATAEQLEATRSRITFTSDLKASVSQADIVIEAVPEVEEIKINFYKELSDDLPPESLLFTNTSTMLPSQFAEYTGRADKYCALHFANLIWTLNLAEIMAQPETSAATLTAATRFAIEINMVPIPIQKEQNGYVLNSTMVTLVNAAQTLVTNGVSTPEDIDRTYMIMNRGCKVGPFGMMDFVGMKTMYDALISLSEVNDDNQMAINAAYLKENFLDKGLLGLQTEKGYYCYPEPRYQEESFLSVPDISKAAGIAALTMPS